MTAHERKHHPMTENRATPRDMLNDAQQALRTTVLGVADGGLGPAHAV